MDMLAFLRDLLLPKAVLKFQMLAFVIFVAAVFGLRPNPAGLVGYALFFLTYLSTYFYNDLLDYADDLKRAVYPAKLLAHGRASQNEYLLFASNLFALGVLLTTLWDPRLGVVAFLAVFLNNLRSHVKHIFLRQIFLIAVETMNFLAGWVSIYENLPPMLALSVFLEYSTIYALGHIVYKVRGWDLSVLRRTDIFPFVVLAAFLALPTAAFLTMNFAVALFGIGGALIYIAPQHLFTLRNDLHDERVVRRAFWQHTLLMAIVGMWFLAGALTIL